MFVVVVGVDVCRLGAQHLRNDQAMLIRPTDSLIDVFVPDVPVRELFGFRRVDGPPRFSPVPVEQRDSLALMGDQHQVMRVVGVVGRGVTAFVMMLFVAALTLFVVTVSVVCLAVLVGVFVGVVSPWMFAVMFPVVIGAILAMMPSSG